MTASSLIGACLRVRQKSENVGHHHAVTRFLPCFLSLFAPGRSPSGTTEMRGRAPEDRAKLHDPKCGLRAEMHDESLMSAPLHLCIIFIGNY